MIAYVIYSVFLLIGLFFLNKKNKPMSYLIIFLSCVSLYSIRSLSVGTDTENYIEIFFNSAQINLTGTIEPLFLLFNYILYKISYEVAFYFFCISSVFFVLWCTSIEKIGRFHKDVSWLVIFTSYPFLSLFNITRQSLAIALSILCFNFILNKRYILFFIFALAAILTHYSSILVIVLILCLVRNNNPFIYLIFSMIFSLFFSLGALDYISGNSIKYSKYGDLSDNGITGIMLITLVSVKLIIFYLFYFLYYYNDYLYRSCLSLFSVGFSLLVVLKVFGFPDEGPLRIITYFVVFEVFLFPYLFLTMKNIKVRVFFKILFYCFMFFSFFYTIISGAGGLYPYTLDSKFSLF